MYTVFYLYKGVSGIAAAIQCKKRGHEAVIFEQSSELGGVWSSYHYDGLAIQNTYQQYCFADYPWPFQPSRHATRNELLKYFGMTVDHFKLDLRLAHKVLALEENKKGGWDVQYTKTENKRITESESFDFLFIATGQYGAHNFKKTSFPGENQFKGKILIERDVGSMIEFKDKRIVVVGNGKCAVDIASGFASVNKSASTFLLVRNPRWSIPDYLLELFDYTLILFTRFGTVMMVSWAHPTWLETFIHSAGSFIIKAFWVLLGIIS